MSRHYIQRSHFDETFGQGFSKSALYRARRPLGVVASQGWWALLQKSQEFQGI